MKKAIIVCCLILQLVFAALYIWCDDTWVFDGSLPKEDSLEYLNTYWEHLENDEIRDNESFVISFVENTGRISLLIMFFLFLMLFENVRKNKKLFYIKLLSCSALIAFSDIFIIKYLCTAYIPFYLKWTLLLPQSVLLALYAALLLSKNHEG